MKASKRVHDPCIAFSSSPRPPTSGLHDSPSASLLAFFLLFSALCFPSSAFPSPVPYEGKLAINGLNFDGVASFTFALRDANGTVHWRNGADANASINVPVDRGHYVVLLGGQGMNAFPPNLFLEHPELYLQVRFYRSDAEQWLYLQPDQRIHSSPHALSAEVARMAEAVKSGAITLDMLSPQVLAELNATITRSRLSAGIRQDLNATLSQGAVSLDNLSPDVLAALQILPSVSTQPFARYDRSDGSAQVEVTARGHDLSYQWLKDGQPINGATAPVLHIADADTDENATYAVRVTNSLGETTSQAVSLQDAIGAPGPPLLEANATEVPRNGLVLWLDAEDLNADGIADNLPEDTKIFNWADLSGDDRNFTQSDPNLAPTVKIVGNRQALHFAQTAWMKNDENATVNTVFFALNVPAGLREVSAYLLKDGGWNGMFKHTHSAHFGHQNSAHFSIASEIRTNGAKLNGLLLFDQPSVVSAFRTRTNWTFQSLNIGYTWEGLFHEVIFYDRILSDAERADVEDYLMDKWGMAELVATEPEDGLLALYKFEPNLSDKLILDSSGNGHHVELSGPLSVTPLASGVDGDALDLPGDDANYLELPAYDASLKTIALWLKPDFTIEAGAPVTGLFETSGNNGLLFNESSPNFLNNEIIAIGSFSPNISGARHTSTTASVSDGWFHLALSWNVAAGQYKYYLDGEPVATTPGTFGHYSLISSQPLKFGRRFWHAEYNNISSGLAYTNAYSGAIDELRIYDVSLTAAEIQALHNQVENPIIRTTGEHNATIGTGFSLSLQVDNGANFFQAEGLPEGLSLNVATGEISGIAQDPGYHRVYVTASNDHGKTSGVVAIHARPAIDDDGWPVDVPDGSSLPQNGLVLWLDANDVDADGAFDAGTDHLHLANWADKAGHDHNATQATAFRQPEIRSGQLPERPGLNLLRFDGNQSLAFPTLNNGRTFFWVVNRGAGNTGNAAFMALEGTNYVANWGNNSHNAPFRYAFEYVNDGLQRRNGENRWLGSASSFLTDLQVLTLRTTDFQPADLIGKEGNDDFYFTGNIGEILVYDRALSESEIRLVEQYLGSKWGIALNQEPEVEAEAGLIGYWNFDEGEGTVIHDLSGNDVDGVLENTTESDVWQDGILGGSVRLDGLNDQVNILGHSGEQKTISFWFDAGIALEDNGTAVRLCEMRWGSTNRQIWLNDFNSSISGEVLSFKDKEGGITYVTEANANLSNGWNHLALVRDGGLSRYRMYLNGTEADVNASASGHTAYVPAQNKSIFLAESPTGASDVRYSGKIDEFRIYDRSLSAAEVLAQYQYPTSDDDNDGLTVTQEWNLGTDEDDADSDDDGYSDGLEVSLGTDPLDPTSTSAQFGLQVHLPFDGADGNLTADASGNNRPGTLVGFESNQTIWIPGKIGNAIQFDGTNDWGSIPYSLDDNFTIALWLKSTDVRGNGNWGYENTLLTGNTNSYQVCIHTGKFSAWAGWYTGSKLRQTSNASVSTGSWVHVAFSRQHVTGNYGNFRTYINGSKDAGPIYKNEKPFTGALLYMGKAITDANYFLNGALDDLRIYDRTLSDAEVKALYDLGQ